MPKYVPVSRKGHGDKRWLPSRSYLFAANTWTVPLVAAELPKAALTFPICFIRNGDSYLPSALLSVEPQRNAFVTAAGGWIGGYIPSAFRGYPFALIPNEARQLVLCIDEESGSVTSESTGEPFFNESGELTASTKKVFEFLSQVENNRAATARAVSALTSNNLIVPWTTQAGKEGDKSLPQGLFRINEEGMNSLPMEAFQDLRQAGSVPLAYCQLLSMQNITRLHALAAAHAKHREPAGLQKPTLDMLLGTTESENLDIDWSQFSEKSE